MTDLWYPPATRELATSNAGPFTGGAPKALLHTTEGHRYADALAVYHNRGYWPHATATFERGRVDLFQHLPLNLAGKALEHPPGTGATNTDTVIQIELVGSADPDYARRNGLLYVEDWPDAYLAGIAGWLRFVHDNAGVPLVAPFPFARPGVVRRPTWQQWHSTGGIYGHCHVPANCVTADTRDLCADLVWRPAGDLLPGDELVGFDEMPDSQVGRRFRPSVVERNEIRRDALLRVTTPRGSIRCNYEHPFLTRKGRPGRNSSEWGRWAWVKAADLKAGDEVMYVLDPWETERTWEAGWLAGMYDGEGSLSSSPHQASHLTCAQRESPTADELILAIKERVDARVMHRSWGAVRTPMVQVTINRRAQVMKMLGAVRPPRLLAKARPVWEGGSLGKTASRTVVQSVEPCGTGLIASMTTSTRTFIADGFAVHNTHTDPGAINISRILELAHGGPAPMPNPAPPEVTNVARGVRLRGGGVWKLLADGGIFTDRGAPFFGSMGGQHLNAPAVALVATPAEAGYWIVSADGGIFAFGDAHPIAPYAPLMSEYGLGIRRVVDAVATAAGVELVSNRGELYDLDPDQSAAAVRPKLGGNT